MKVRTRIAPSPTGFAHVGTAYTAIFNWAYARKNKGEFIIRIEDTDQKREVKGSEKAIYKSLEWLGLDWDESPQNPGKYGPYTSSKRLDIYKAKIDSLLEKGLAFKDAGAIRLKNPGKTFAWKDLVRGEISFPSEEVADFVIQKSDGFPTYNFAVVVDDIAMRITHVIRGEEHISNTHRQLALYEVLGASPPKFAHHPTLRNKDHQKLSKRRDPVDLRIFQKEGYLPEALVNFLSLLGWSHPEEKEIFSLDEFVAEFSLERVRKSGPIFNIDKLNWINGEYIREADDKELMSALQPIIPKKWDRELVLKTIPLVKTRIKKLSDFTTLAGPIFKRPTSPPNKLFRDKHKIHLKEALIALTKVGDNWTQGEIDKALVSVVDKHKFHTGDFFMNLRVSQFSSSMTPPINESLGLIGKKETLLRLKRVLK